jgi:uncharacterized protein
MDITKLKRVASVPIGILAWFGLAIAADYVLVTQLELASSGLRFAALGLTQFAIGGAIVVLALRLAGLTPADVGFTTRCLNPDMFIGLTIAVAFAALQFLVIIPATGGSSRSDVVANAAQIGETVPSLAGFLVLAAFGATSEELLFRGLLLGGGAALMGGGTVARVVASAVTILLFAFSHGYQGWAGIVDTGVFGGMLLSLLYWWRGARLAAPIAAHAGWNIIAALVIFTAF